MAAPRILAFAGSLRAGSLNKKLAKVAAEGARKAGADVTLIDLRDYQMPIYDGDLEAKSGLPETATKLKKLFLEHDGLLICSPEYNSSISAVLKNTIDWLSRPAPNETPLAAFNGKVALLLAASPGALGGLRGLVHLRAILGNINVLVLPDQKAIPKAGDVFDENDKLKDAAMQQQIEALSAKLAQTVAKLRG